MIIANGTIEIGTISNAGTDDKGYPIATQVTYGEPILCQYSHTAYNRLCLVYDENATSVHYEILIEEQALPEVGTIRITDFDKGVIGDFPVASIEKLEAVCEYKITV